MSSKNSSEVVEGPFRGSYGQWYLTRGDVSDVQIYRASLGVLCFTQSLSILLALSNIATPSAVYDVLYLTGIAAFGVSLAKIHIYVKPLHTLLKYLVLASATGSLALLAAKHSLVPLVYENPTLLLAVGWQYVALTGIFIKEAVCFQRSEAIGLALLIPILTGGHFFGILPDSLERLGGGLFIASFIWFCVGKFVQDPKDDLGDMSVFQHRAQQNK